MKTTIHLHCGVFVSLLCSAASPTPAQPFAVVVDPSNPTVNLSSVDLRAMFTGSVTHWPNQSRIVLAHRENGSRPNRFLMDRLLKTSWPDYKRRLENLEFMGQEPVIVRVLASDAAACKFVFNVPGALALIESGSIAEPECRELRLLRIDGLAPGQEGYRLK